MPKPHRRQATRAPRVSGSNRAGRTSPTRSPSAVQTPGCRWSSIDQVGTSVSDADADSGDDEIEIDVTTRHGISRKRENIECPKE